MFTLSNEKEETFRYNLGERLVSDRLTWLNAGSQPVKHFKLLFSDASPLPSIWPSQVDAFDDITLFDANTGLRLPFFPDVEVDREYIAVIHGYFYPTERIDIRVDLIPYSKHGWKDYTVYKVKAMSFSQYAARFFIRLKANLRKKAPSIFPVWPLVIRTPHLIYHDTDNLFVFIEGEQKDKNNLKIQTFPRSSLTCVVRQNAVQLIHFSCGARKQMVSGEYDSQLLQLGRFTHILRYDYFIRRDMDRIASPPTVTIIDSKGNEVKGDTQEGVTSRTKLYVHSEFDGEICLESEKAPLPERRILKGGEELELEVSMGQSLKVFQGLDCVRNIVFVRSRQRDDFLWTDAQLCRRLKRMSGREVEASRALAEFIHFFRGWHSVETWLKQKQVDSHISTKAQVLLYDVMRKIEKGTRNV